MSTISAGKSVPNGLVFSSDASGDLIFQVSGTVTALTIASSGAINLIAPLGPNQGGTGVSLTPTNGQLLIGDGVGYTLANLTAGSGITVTNAAGSITIASSGGGGAQDYIVQSYGIV
jgi:hypothetical protein